MTAAPGTPEPVDAGTLGALAARLGFRLDPGQVADMHAAVLAAEPAIALLRARPLDPGLLDPAHGDRWLRPGGRT